MSPKKLPDHFPSPTVAELRALWKRYPDDAELQRALMEIERLRKVIDRVDSTRETLERAFRDAGLGSLAGLYSLRVMLGDEKRRAGRFGP